MKKVALSLLALALFGAGAFAQEAPALKIGGYLDWGTLTTIKADSGTSTGIKGDDSGIGGGSYEFRLAYGTDKAGFVGNVRLEALQDGANAKYNTQSAYYWFKVPGAEMVKVQAGNYNNDGAAWNMLDDKGDKQTKNSGVAVQVTPAEGVTVGGGFVPMTNMNALWSAGIAAVVPATVQVNAALLTGYAKEQKIGLDNAAVSFKLLLDGPLSAKGGINFYNLAEAAQDTYKLDTAIIDFTVGYAVTDALSVGLLTYIYTYAADLKEGAVFDESKSSGNTLGSGDSAAVSYKINPYVNYTVDPITAVGFGLTYFQGSADRTKVQNKVTQFEINPNATFTIDPNSKIYVNYLYDAKSGDDAGSVDKTWSTIKVDYRYTF